MEGQACGAATIVRTRHGSSLEETLPVDAVVPQSEILDAISANILQGSNGGIGYYVGKDPAFAPEPFTALYRRSLYQSMRSLADQSLGLLQKRLKRFPEEVQEHAAELLTLETEIFNRCRQLVERKIGGMRIRCHGDYHLGQVLYTGKDFVIVDFEGEPSRSLSERRFKRSPLRDVAGMIRSFHYASYSTLLQDQFGTQKQEDDMREWAEVWFHHISRFFIQGYLEQVKANDFIPQEEGDLKILLDTFLLEKAVYELNYELNNRPDWVLIPLRGIKSIIKRYNHD